MGVGFNTSTSSIVHERIADPIQNDTNSRDQRPKTNPLSGVDENQNAHENYRSRGEEKVHVQIKERFRRLIARTYDVPVVKGRV